MILGQIQGRGVEVHYGNLVGEHCREQLRKKSSWKSMPDVIKRFCVVGVEWGWGGREKRGKIEARTDHGEL